MKSKILKIVAIVLVSLVFATSIFFNVVLGMSTGFTLSMKNSYEERYRIYDITSSKFYLLEDGSGITISSTSVNEETKERAEDTYHCKFNKSTMVSDCTRKYAVYNESNELLKAAYFPGDDYQYFVVEGVKGKSFYSNDSLLGVSFYPFYNFLYQYCAILASDDQNLNFEVDTNFNFKSFGFDKVITVTYKTPVADKPVTKYEIFVDENDVINKIILNDSITMEMEVNTSDISFSDLESYSN